MLATVDRITYTGAFGKRDSVSTRGCDFLYRVDDQGRDYGGASMQLVERGKLTLDEPAAKLRNWESFKC
jgi:hypothetical protein